MFGYCWIYHKFSSYLVFGTGSIIGPFLNDLFDFESIGGQVCRSMGPGNLGSLFILIWILNTLMSSLCRLYVSVAFSHSVTAHV